ncbi:MULTISPECIES: DUF1801 domain-containing protein [unclassified Flavobacterium]|uniref:DUF1801 domain-containing protein n=1 Tax=unclassified Flavobacterium TaxID=196869 RepID=UPI0013D7F2E6|nr:MULTISPECIES: DUF1801 domain-containing protein [unclassified Flavobacterium]MBA5792517.1 DUF1801 domain-containing protein [Flavobacterium sp. xlx-221]
MAKNKTEFTNENVQQFIDAVENTQKKQDSLQLITLMEEITGEKARMWGPTIVGFGEYEYKYASGHGGSAPVLGFSPRKAAFSLYVFTGLKEHEHLLDGLGKFTKGKACIYVKKMEDINTDVLIKLMKESIAYVENKFQRITPTN